MSSIPESVLPPVMRIPLGVRRLTREVRNPDHVDRRKHGDWRMRPVFDPGELFVVQPLFSSIDVDVLVEGRTPEEAARIREAVAAEARRRLTRFGGSSSYSLTERRGENVAPGLFEALIEASVPAVLELSDLLVAGNPADTIRALVRAGKITVEDVREHTEIL